MNQMIKSSVSEIEAMQKLSKELFTSALFDSKNPSQIFAKILAGREVGLEPIASITGINMIQGKPCMGANLIATLLDRHPSYSYEVIKSTNQECEIEIFYNGKSKGKYSFTMKEAVDAGLAGKDVWKKYPSDMLFARCITRAARRAAPGIFGGSPIYTPEELNVNMNEEGFIIDGEIENDEEKEVEKAHDDQIILFNDLCKQLNIKEESVKKRLLAVQCDKLEDVPVSTMTDWISKLENQLEKMDKYDNKN